MTRAGALALAILVLSGCGRLIPPAPSPAPPPTRTPDWTPPPPAPLPPRAVAKPPPDPVKRARAFHLDLDAIIRSAPRPPAAASPKPTKGALAFRWPVTGRVAERYGPAGRGRFNQGVELATTPGAIVRAAEAGTVVYVGTGVPGYGGLVLIDHGRGWVSAYGRMARLDAVQGDAIARGAVLGSAGTGPTPRVHFQLRRNRIATDPTRHLPPPPVAAKGAR